MDGRLARTLNRVNIKITKSFSVDESPIPVLTSWGMGDFLTVSEFAKRLKIEPATVYTAIKDKRVQHQLILGRLGIPRSELGRFKRRKNGDQSKVLLKVA